MLQGKSTIRESLQFYKILSSFWLIIPLLLNGSTSNFDYHQFWSYYTTFPNFKLVDPKEHCLQIEDSQPLSGELLYHVFID
jgi:hypothetical protein